MRFKIKRLLFLIGGVFILLFVTGLFLFLSVNYYIDNYFQLSFIEDLKIKRINFIAEKIARSIKYYDNLPNLYIGKNEIEGYCSDYAIQFALKTGANLIVQNQDKKLNIPNGVYKLTNNIPRKIKNEIKSFYKNSRSGWIGPWLNKTWPLSLFHPILGIYSIELIEERTIITHFDTPAIGAERHVWNELNGVAYDICTADMWRISFTGIDTYYYDGNYQLTKEEGK